MCIVLVFFWDQVQWTFSQLHQQSHEVELKWSHQSCHYSVRASDILSSHAHFVLLRSCRMCFTGRMWGAKIPNGSYLVLIVESTPLLVSGFVWISMCLTPHTSESLWIGRQFFSKSSSLSSLALSSSGTDARGLSQGMSMIGDWYNTELIILSRINMANVLLWSTNTDTVYLFSLCTSNKVRLP